MRLQGGFSKSAHNDQRGRTSSSAGGRVSVASGFVRAVGRPVAVPTRGRVAARGQALVEYALLLAVAVTFSLTILASSRKFLRTAIQGFNVTLENEIETCNLQQENIWNN